MKKVTFIYPAIGKKQGKKYIKTWKMEPLPVATLASYVPENVDIEFFDDRLELIDYDSKTDLVAINVETYTARRAYGISKKFRDRGIPVVMGGYHPTHLPNETGEYADSVVVGQAESVWADLLNDVKNGQLKKRYSGNGEVRSKLPLRSIFEGKDYLKLGLVETGRGCPFTCEFCHITTFYDGKYYPRPIPDIIEDIINSGRDKFFFVDDNLVANPKHTIALCKELEKLNITWAGQGTLTMAKNPELLKWMKRSGCMMMLIGFESLESENLKQMDKDWSLKLGEQKDLIRRIHEFGIGIYATFIFGFDYDTDDTFKKTIDFSLENRFFYAAFNHLLPFPGTPLYKRLENEKSLLVTNWWLSNKYSYGDVIFKPKQMSPERLSENCLNARKEFFKFSAISKRGFSQLKRNQSLSTFLLFLISNMNLKDEVDGKYGLPLGEGLDELPK